MSLSAATRDGILFVKFNDARLLEEAQLAEVERDVISQLEKSTEERIVLNFAKVQFMSSSMLGKLVKVHKKCQEFKVKLKLCGITPEIQQIFKITKLDKLFDIATDEEAARKAFLKKGIFG